MSTLLVEYKYTFIRSWMYYAIHMDDDIWKYVSYPLVLYIHIYIYK